jgi:hypothetical protein
VFTKFAGFTYEGRRRVKLNFKIGKKRLIAKKIIFYASSSTTSIFIKSDNLHLGFFFEVNITLETIFSILSKFELQSSVLPELMELTL